MFQATRNRLHMCNLRSSSRLRQGDAADCSRILCALRLRRQAKSDTPLQLGMPWPHCRSEHMRCILSVLPTTIRNACSLQVNTLLIDVVSLCECPEERKRILQNFSSIYLLPLCCIEPSADVEQSQLYSTSLPQ